MPPKPGLRSRRPIQPSEAVEAAYNGGWYRRYLASLMTAKWTLYRPFTENDYQGIKQDGYFLAGGKN